MKEYMKAINKLWFAMTAFDLVLVAITMAITLLVDIQPIYQYDRAAIFTGILMIPMLICLLLGTKSQKRRVKAMQNDPLPKKLEKYRGLLIKRYLLFNIINFIALVGLLICMNYGYLVFCAMAFVLLLLSKPALVKLKFELDFSEEEIKQFDKIKIERR